jgi:polar amino acid transport system substrate-binding protein
MAASPWRSVFLSLIIAVAVWLWTLVGVLYAIRWNAIARPLPPVKVLFPYGEMRVGVDASYAPFAVASADGMVGLDIDLARALAEKIGVPARFVNLGFDGLYDALRTDQVDVLISALIVDPTRGDAVVYSRPYFNAGLVLVSSRSGAVREMEDLPGRSLAVEFGSQAQTEAQRWLRRLLPFDVLPYELPEYALDAARLGEADAALVENVTARLYLRNYEDWQPRIAEVTVVPFAVATRADRLDRAAAIDAALRTLMADGSLDAILRRYL